MVDVLIVGGGPGGSSCAKRLVDAGADVALVDRASFPRDKVCAGWITPSAVRALDLDLADYARGRTLQPFTGFRTGLLPGSLQLTDFGQVVSYGIRRCEFDAYLLERSHVRCIESQYVKSVRRENGAWIIDDRIRARMLVGAGGHFCPVARALNPGVTETSVVAAQEIEFELDGDRAESVAGSTPELFFWPDLLGYAWCVRKGAFLNIGAGRLTPSPLPAAVQEFAAFLEQRGLLPQSRAAWKGHAYLLNCTSRRRVYGDGVVLIGDAAGLALAPSGEGILAAIESGLLAADAILNAAPDFSERQLAAYGDQITGRFGKRLAADEHARSIPGWLRRAGAKVALGLPWLTRRLVLEHGFLHSRRPDLAR
jgi:flavin-dependent dehydrogenase